MVKQLELYKCRVCENIVEVIHEGKGTLSCCDECMSLIETNIPDEDNHHIIKLEYIDDLTKKLTSTHPMTQDHHIDFIEVISNDKKYVKRKNFKIDEPLELILRCKCEMGFYARLYCNIHGLYETKF